MNKILHCPKCSLYTLKDKCQNCSSITLSTRPAKFSIEDKYSKYRQLYKKQLLNHT